MSVTRRFITCADELAESERLRTLWFNENSAAQAALGRVRELADEWEAAGGAYRRHADLIRRALDGEDA